MKIRIYMVGSEGIIFSVAKHFHRAITVITPATGS